MVHQDNKDKGEKDEFWRVVKHAASQPEAVRDKIKGRCSTLLAWAGRRCGESDSEDCRQDRRNSVRCIEGVLAEHPSSNSPAKLIG
jgi:hypothetical protein